MRAAVVGAGIVGACTAFELARAGAEVTVFEQFEIDHDQGSSFGDSRIIRRFYDDPYYTRLMMSAYPLWRALEARSGDTLFEKLGGLYFGPRSHARLAAAQAGMRSVGSSPELIGAAELRSRFPAFAFDDDEAGLVDEEAGSLRASRCVRAAIAAARDAGAVVHTGVKVDRIAPGSGRDQARRHIDVRIAGGTTPRFDRVAVCAGPWSGDLLQALALPLRPTRQQYIHLRLPSDAAAFKAGVMPVWIDAGTDWYGFPEHGDVAGAKIAWHQFGETVDPDRVNREVDADVVERTRTYVRRRLPLLANGAVTFKKVCLYTVSPDEDFIVDAAADIPGCFFVTGCSGHAFKFGTLLGKIIADLAFDREPPVDISRFRLSRLRS